MAKKYKSNVYQSDDGFIGSAKEVAEHLGATISHVYASQLHGWKIKGHEIALIKNNHRLWGKKLRVYRDDELVFEGKPEQIAKKCCVAESTVQGVIYRKGKLLCEYTIRDEYE